MTQTLVVLHSFPKIIIKNKNEVIRGKREIHLAIGGSSVPLILRRSLECLKLSLNCAAGSTFTLGQTRINHMNLGAV
ncbi:hypothetical protein ACFLVS_02595 [Chloroflexota bacterium]